MAISNMSNFSKLKSSICPTNDLPVVGDGAALPFVTSAAYGARDMHYYNTTFSGGPGAKCPPDRRGGSSDCVTGSLAPHSSPPFVRHSLLQPDRDVSLRSRPTAIPIPPITYTADSDDFTPPLTPDGSVSCCSSQSSIEFVAPPAHSNPAPSEADFALNFLKTLTPNYTTFANGCAKPVLLNVNARSCTTIMTSIQNPPKSDKSDGSMQFTGVILNIPGANKTLYIRVDAQCVHDVYLSQGIAALLDFAADMSAQEPMDLIMVLDKSMPTQTLKTLLHSLMYVGGTVVSRPAFEVAKGVVLVGMEI
ncbi:hypothetical protein FISHEDRAFT_77552 [Fistulina hepatica ATCC 64428]|uniref:Uncharacterized protein n=1 Tax=Fistulina hepatica ATCC 64428 TaxID=1128425 RepID=A0A0D7A1W3_9AGAR|nr:hypothetical protein FISHEDRAFT_77552 [Fistulina hepatica ATCC 64428]